MLVIVAVDFIVSVLIATAVIVENIVFLLTSIEIIWEISLSASDFAEAPGACIVISLCVKGASVPSVITLAVVPALLPIIFVPVIVKFTL